MLLSLYRWNQIQNSEQKKNTGRRTLVFQKDRYKMQTCINPFEQNNDRRRIQFCSSFNCLCKYIKNVNQWQPNFCFHKFLYLIDSRSFFHSLNIIILNICKMKPLKPLLLIFNGFHCQKISFAPKFIVKKMMFKSCHNWAFWNELR